MNDILAATDERDLHRWLLVAVGVASALLSVLTMLVPVQALGAEQPKASLADRKEPRIEVNDGDLEVYAVPDLSQDPFGPLLGNGTVATPSEWPASVVARKCSATLIGPRVLLTAAHCVGNAADVRVHNKGLPDFSGVCTRHDKWSRTKNLSPDVALCLMAPMARKGLFFESLQLDVGHVDASQRLTLSGYGCTDPNTHEKEDPPVFRIGPAIVATAPGGSAEWPQWLITEPAKTGSLSFACRGDSGGAAYRVPTRGVRGVVGVISAVNEDKVTYVAALASSEIRGFIRKWMANTATMTADRKSARVCGVDLFELPCRPAPP